MHLRHRAQVSDCKAIARQREEMPKAGRRVGTAEPDRRHGIYSRDGSVSKVSAAGVTRYGG